MWLRPGKKSKSKPEETIPGYNLEPQDDITAYELSLLMQCVANMPKREVDSLPDSAKRHMVVFDICAKTYKIIEGSHRPLLQKQNA